MSFCWVTLLLVMPALVFKKVVWYSLNISVQLLQWMLSAEVIERFDIGRVKNFQCTCNPITIEWPNHWQSGFTSREKGESKIASVSNLRHSSFPQVHEVGNVGIIANFVLPYICSFLLYLHQAILVNTKLSIKGYMSITFQGQMLYLTGWFMMGELNKVGNVGILVL